MKAFVSLMTVVFLLPSFALAGAVRPKHSLECVAHAISKEMKIKELDANKALPQLHYESETALADFQDAVEPPWGFRPDVFLNVYVIEQNAIYLMDDDQYYTKYARFIDDSLAHELVHYFQVVYQKTLVPDDASEQEAVFLQTWFRQKFMEQKQDPCSY